MNGGKVRVGDIDILYRWDGTADGAVLMMAHAMGTSHRLWDWQVPALQDRYRLLRCDWRGHGDTDAPTGAYTLDQFIADLGAGRGRESGDVAEPFRGDP